MNRAMLLLLQEIKCYSLGIANVNKLEQLS